MADQSADLTALQSAVLWVVLTVPLTAVSWAHHWVVVLADLTDHQ
eukprot:CAMPEP_0114447032 /NCGR_PEP_ID=MMETSP0103-20121206/19562_1 /TAXON_ID=37642 ORGANISM="Paraphysomonas imperforata, Strain PA2" /NCGR_SAMPLE_ID=MMETSP0103 /ASSEMBLY_ACC=CAM_ASM_000201 /LENGTH=44 /DNA_ID= /DNA_START= /DNA_END= /DNA_ORIENTATION=